MLDKIARNEQWVVAGCLLLIVAACWAYLLSGAGTMQEMGGMLMPMSSWPWSLSHALLMLIMWIAMMAAMMLPSAVPMVLLYSRILHRDSESAKANGATAMFTAGYLAVWIGFSILATGLQFALEWAALLSPMMQASSATLAGTVLLLAGVYQLLPAKRACLHHCRSPLSFLMSYWRKGWPGAFAMGIRHGAYCLGCCWGIMLLLFVGGLMNLLWVAGLAIYVLVEKLVPGGDRISRIAALPLLIAGVTVLAGMMPIPA